MTRVSVVLTAVLVAIACAHDTSGVAPVTRPTGPPDVRDDVVASHAEQFDTDVPERAAGTQEEQAASTYLLGHLQQAGYIVRLEGVPVRDLVKSTDLLAQPPSGRDATYLVAVGYDTPPTPTGDEGRALGLWLELARAVNVADPDHASAFAALGAEHTDVAGGRLGSRRLVNLLRDDEATPSVITLVAIAPGEPVAARGNEAEPLLALASELGIETGESPPDDVDVFGRAGFRSTFLSGDPSDVGRVLLEFLTEGGS